MRCSCYCKVRRAHLKMRHLTSVHMKFKRTTAGKCSIFPTSNTYLVQFGKAVHNKCVASRLKVPYTDPRSNRSVVAHTFYRFTRWHFVVLFAVQDALAKTVCYWLDSFTLFSTVSDFRVLNRHTMIERPHMFTVHIYCTCAWGKFLFCLSDINVSVAVWTWIVSLDYLGRELICAWKTSHKHNKAPSRLW